MADAISIAKLSLLTDLDRLTVMSQNTSNASTIGYRRQVPISIPFDDRFTPSVNAYDGIERVAGMTDNRPGPLTSTGRKLDLALDGDGYFRIGTNRGERYTRRGDFHLDATGRLVTAANDPVLGTSGEIRLTSEDVSISANGDIQSGSDVVGHLELVQFPNSGRLVYEGDGLLRAQTAPEIDHSASRIRQGMLESSNVNFLHEMTGMMETSRHFSMTRNVITAYDQMLDSAINTLAQL